IEKDFIVWYNKYNLQIPEMDEQHKRIVKLVNEFKEAWDLKKSANELVKIIKNLINYSSYHFKSEEEYMGEYKYTEIKEHKAEHKKLTELLQKVEKDLSKNKQDQVQNDLENIKKQLIDHFTESDSKYIDTFKMFGH
ncbi:MAG: hemerythrin family protein, partial [Bacteroidales bacterium]|nr:hemerythrin family protein [Bacteroidales bacterium]